MYRFGQKPEPCAIKEKKKKRSKDQSDIPPKGTGLAIFFENRTAASDLYFVTIKCRVVAPRFSLKVFRLIRSHLPDRKETPVLITFCTAGFKSSASLVNVGFFLCLVRVSKKKKISKIYNVAYSCAYCVFIPYGHA